MTGAGPGLRAWALLLLLGLIFGSSFMFTNIVVREIPPLTLAAFRLAFAAALLFAAVAATGARLPRIGGAGGRLWAIAAFSALFGTLLPFWLISWSQVHIPSALTALLMAPMPMVSLILSHFLIKGERMTAPRIAGFFAGFIGVALLIGPEAFGMIGGWDFRLLGQLASLGAMLCYALNGIVLKRAGPVDPLGMSAAVIGVGALVGVPLALWVEAPDLGAFSATSWALAAALGLGATAMAQIIMLALLALAGPPFLASVNYQVPLWAAAFGVFFLGEALDPAFPLAMGLILAGLALAQFGGRRRAASPGAARD
ncbi:DMT family transporter [Pikeienuella sp. HZG-20]|uniref:DMT family transporter n=1 Tax=Paludibacillus litoralis TaxID=3133267 RepID=UPI0030EB4609